MHPDLQAVVKVLEVSAADAVTIAFTVGHQPLPDPASYALLSPVVWVARSLQLPVLSFDTKPYEAYGVATRSTP
ncbi:hypothetical protein [Actinomadura rupiterrae]|uniref:hypothetical protein n=1 Tax=Actinomadura rupiterrae TaxID=559627 RepID=UPI0020A43563|nr:hypothetical protein [Actinomadura rupiterrae]MCP2343162.1 hypothetical protein [Actinomadura rupiterrae]